MWIMSRLLRKNRNQRDSTGVKKLVLNVDNPGLIPSTKYGPLNTARSKPEYTPLPNHQKVKLRLKKKTN